MRRSTRKSCIGVQADGLTTIGNFSTKFSLKSFVKRVEKLTDDQRNAIKKTGFGNLLLLRNQMLSKNLLVELMETWRCENRAFHLLPGQLKITLMDVAVILGLRVVGHPVIINDNQPFSELEREYGAALWKRKITIASLEERLDSLGGTVNEDFVRAFLLFTIGTLLFPNGNGKVDSRYLSLLENLDDVCQFAWGAAVLEDIFMWLNKRKQMSVQYVGGCLIFLQIWSYEHIDIARPSLLDSYLPFPRACRWENNKSHHRKWFTARFKELQDHQITWKLQPTRTELEVNIVKELLKAQHGRDELLRPQNSSTSCSIISVVEVKSNSDMDIANKVQEGNLEPLTTSQYEPEVQTDAVEHPFTSCISELHKENVELVLQAQDSCINFTTSNEEDLRTRNRLLEVQNMELKKEIDKLRCENRLLKDHLMSSPLLEEHNEELKKEVEKLRKENRLLSSSSDNLVDRLERILLELDINSTEET